MPYTSRDFDLDLEQVNVSTSETTTSTSFTDLLTAGPAITITSGVTQDHLLWLGAWIRNSNANIFSFMSVAIGGVAAVNTNGPCVEGFAADNELGPGWLVHAPSQASPAIHTAKYAVEANTGGFQHRRITGVAC